MKKYLILVKHSLPEIVENLPARAWKLSKVGKERAKRLADQLQGYQPEVIISSVEPKAMETAGIIAEKSGLPVYVVGGLHEHERSNVPFLSKEDFQKTVNEFFSKPTELVFGDETAEQSYERFEQAVRSVLSYHHGKTILLVAHGAVISLFVSRLTGIHDFSFWSELGLPSFVVIDPQAKALIKKKNIT